MKRTMTQDFKRSDLLAEMGVNKQDTSDFWLRLDTLIDVCSLTESDKTFADVMSEKWSEFFTEYSFNNTTYNYASKYKLGFIFYFEKKINLLRNDKQLYSMLAGLRTKTTALELGEFTYNELVEQVMKHSSPVVDNQEHYFRKELHYSIRRYFNTKGEEDKVKLSGETVTFLQTYQKEINELITDIEKEITKRNTKGNTTAAAGQPNPPVKQQTVEREKVAVTVSDDFKGNDVLKEFGVKKEDEGYFWLKLDTLIEVLALKNDPRELISLMQESWNIFFSDYEFNREVLYQYIHKYKIGYNLMHNQKLSEIRKIKFFYTMLASAIFKLKIIQNNDYLIQSLRLEIKDEEIKFVRNMDSHYTKELQFFFKRYFMSGQSNFNQTITFDKKYKAFLEKYEENLCILRDCILEEIDNRISQGIENEQTQQSADENAPSSDNSQSMEEQMKKLRERYELILGQKNSEIRDLQDELDHYQISGQDEFMYAAEQYDKAIKDLLYKLNSNTNGYILDQLYCYSEDKTELSDENVKMLIQNMFYTLSGFGISAYATGSVGKEMTVVPDKVGIDYRIYNNAIISGEEKGTQIYSGWKFKNKTIIPPLVDIDKEV
ncbi:hypothetical protein [Evansella tamaricis]|uniref:Uncharacterized protein n=1 Tax=Evansella tamaricis TaxID=2069301 RepID=A0ABS6JN66_9BACI|nr:hypothetical protein [Evansella tamaricis]MBU9713855.1 hypothetical protein [Evansella tamaricis]